MIGDRGELRDYFDVQTIERQTSLTVEEGLGLYLARYREPPNTPNIAHIVAALGYLDDVDEDHELPVPKSAIADYWRRRQPQILRNISPLPDQPVSAPIAAPSGQRDPDVGLSEVVALEQQRSIRHASERVGKAVTEVQAGGRPSLAEAKERVACELRLGAVDCRGSHSGRREKLVQIVDAVGAGLGQHHDRALDQGRGRDQRVLGIGQQRDEPIALGLTEKHRHERRGVNDHRGAHSGRPSGP